METRAKRRPIGPGGAAGTNGVIKRRSTEKMEPSRQALRRNRKQIRQRRINSPASDTNVTPKEGKLEKSQSDKNTVMSSSASTAVRRMSSKLEHSHAGELGASALRKMSSKLKLTSSNEEESCLRQLVGIATRIEATLQRIEENQSLLVKAFGSVNEVYAV